MQMIGDDQRGWAWTRALQGVPANEIHLCGDASALPLVKQMCDTMGESLTVFNYDRFTPLEIDPAALPRGYASVRPGDCVVAFSRRDIFEIKPLIERRTGHKCCVIYGALPPEMRRHQAALFNDPNSGFDILVASDAVGMGLNLNIGRIIFHKVKKFEGKVDTCPVSPSAIKQIAGEHNDSRPHCHVLYHASLRMSDRAAPSNALRDSSLKLHYQMHWVLHFSAVQRHST